MRIIDLRGTEVFVDGATARDVRHYISRTFHSSDRVRFSCGGVCGEHLADLEPVGVATLHCRLSGGGGDGGSKLERRDCIPWIVDAKSKPKPLDPAQLARLSWHTCRLTKAPLEEPVLACPLGYLYNKAPVLEALMNKENRKKYTEDIQHIKSISEMTELELVPVDEQAPRSHGVMANDTVSSTDPPKWRCPILSDITMNTVNKFVYFTKCKHVVSRRSLEEMKKKGDSRCPLCNEPYSERLTVPGESFLTRNTVVHLVGGETEVKAALEWLQADQASRPANKKKTARADGTSVKRLRADNDDGETVTAKRFNSLGVTHVSRNEAPLGATSQVWKKIFHDDATKPKEKGYMVRAGMMGGGGGRMQ